jgi:selenide,water dikinase
VASVTAEPLQAPRLTSLSPGAGCACKLPLAKLPLAKLEALFAGLQGTPAMGPAAGDLLIGAAAGRPRPARRTAGARAPGRADRRRRGR